MPTLVSRSLLTAVAVFALAATSCSTSSDSAEAAVKAVSKRKAAPEFTLKDSDGRAVKLSDYRGKVVLLNFWATWCGPCRIEIPWFVEFEKQYKDQGFAVLGVAMDDEGWEVVRPYITDKKVNYRVLVGDDATAQLYGGVENLPTTFVLDREGRIASTHVGLVSKSDYQNEIIELLKAPAARGNAAGGAVELASAK